MAAMTMIVPFLPLYLQELGVTDPGQISIWSGVIFGVNFLTAFLFAPLWGKIADRQGRKLMVLRSGFGMAIVMVLPVVVRACMKYSLHGNVCGIEKRPSEKQRPSLKQCRYCTIILLVLQYSMKV